MNSVTTTMNKLLVSLFLGALALFAGADAFAQAASAADAAPAATAAPAAVASAADTATAAAAAASAPVPNRTRFIRFTTRAGLQQTDASSTRPMTIPASP